MPLTQVRQFGAASSSLGDPARKAFELADDASVDRNIYDVAENPEEGPTDHTFKGLFAGDVWVLGGGAEQGERLALRLGVLDHLAGYSQALQRLAEADFSADIHVAAIELTDALVGLRETYRKAAGKDLPVSEGDIGIIATAVNGIGKAVVEAKRRAAIKTIIVKTDPAVQDATGLIASDLGSDSVLACYVAAALSNSRGSLQQAYNLERTKPDSSFEIRHAMLLRARQIHNSEMAIPAFFAALSEGAKAAGKEHRALREAAEADDFSSQEAATLIGELEVCARSVKAFYKNLQSKE